MTAGGHGVSTHPRDATHTGLTPHLEVLAWTWVRGGLCGQCSSQSWAPREATPSSHGPLLGLCTVDRPSRPGGPTFLQDGGGLSPSPVFTCSSWSPLYQNSSLSKQSLCILQLPLRINSNDKYERGQGPNLPLRISALLQFCPWSPEPAASSELALGPAGKEAELLDHGGVCRALPTCGGQELSLLLQPSCRIASCPVPGLQEQRRQTAQIPT